MGADADIVRMCGLANARSGLKMCLLCLLCVLVVHGACREVLAYTHHVRATACHK